MRYYALVPAAGSGSRMGGGPPKQYLPLAGRPLIRHSLSALAAVERIHQVFVVLAPDDAGWPAAEMADLGNRLVILRCGGETRAQSVANGLRAMAQRLQGQRDIGGDWVLVHDAARPCLTPAMIERLMDEVDDDEAGGILAVPLADTLKRSSDGRHIAETLSRDSLWQAQTPQMFRHRLLLDALDFAPQVTDEASAVEALGLRPRLVAADATNLKVTYPIDLDLAGWILAGRSSA